MNKEIKEEWLAALKSGEYKKGIGMLRSGDDRYCCLGVLCDLHNKKQEVNGWVAHKIVDETKYSYHCSVGYSPLAVQEWSDLKTMITLTKLNDSSDTFDKVIEYIEKQL